MKKLLPLAFLLAGCATSTTYTQRNETAENTNQYADEYRRSPASASAWHECTPHKDAKDGDYSDFQIQATGDELKFKGKAGGKAGGGTAKRDHDFEDDNQYRYVSSKDSIFSSDGETAFFVDKTLVKGKHGGGNVSTQIICDGDACNHTLEWGSVAHFSCE